MNSGAAKISNSIAMRRSAVVVGTDHPPAPREVVGPSPHSKFSSNHKSGAVLLSGGSISQAATASDSESHYSKYYNNNINNSNQVNPRNKEESSHSRFRQGNVVGSHKDSEEHNGHPHQLNMNRRQ